LEAKPPWRGSLIGSTKKGFERYLGRKYLLRILGRKYLSRILGEEIFQPSMRSSTFPKK
jgi:hypothetical protein